MGGPWGNTKEGRLSHTQRSQVVEGVQIRTHFPWGHKSCRHSNSLTAGGTHSAEKPGSGTRWLPRGSWGPCPGRCPFPCLLTVPSWGPWHLQPALPRAPAGNGRGGALVTTTLTGASGPHAGLPGGGRVTKHVGPSLPGAAWSGSARPHGVSCRHRAWGEGGAGPRRVKTGQRPHPSPGTGSHEPSALATLPTLQGRRPQEGSGPQQANRLRPHAIPRSQAGLAVSGPTSWPTNRWAAGVGGRGAPPARLLWTLPPLPPPPAQPPTCAVLSPGTRPEQECRFQTARKAPASEVLGDVDSSGRCSRPRLQRGPPCSCRDGAAPCSSPAPGRTR